MGREEKKSTNSYELVRALNIHHQQISNSDAKSSATSDFSGIFIQGIHTSKSKRKIGAKRVT